MYLFTQISASTIASPRQVTIGSRNNLKGRKNGMDTYSITCTKAAAKCIHFQQKKWHCQSPIDAEGIENLN